MNGIISSSSSPFRSECLLGKVALIYIVYFFIMAASSSPSVSASPSSSPFRSDCLRGKVALITGGGSGIGFEIARQLLRHGCRGAVICGRREKFLRDACAALSMMTIQRDEQQQQKPPQVLYHVCDVRNFNDCEAAIDYTRRSFDNQLDVLVNGAAGNFLARAKELSAKGFATVMAIDTCGTFNMSRAAHALLKETAANNTTTTTVIINISATLQSPATWWQAHASAAKSAVDSLTRSLALEWGSDSIRVVGIAPGPIANTPGTTKLAPPVPGGENNKNSILMTTMIQQGIPLQRMGEAYEIGHAVVYLATAQYVTGDVLIVDGGQWLYKPPIVPAAMVTQLSRQVEAASRAQAPTTTTTKRNNMQQSKL